MVVGYWTPTVCKATAQDLLQETLHDRFRPSQLCQCQPPASFHLRSCGGRNQRHPRRKPQAFARKRSRGALHELILPSFRALWPLCAGILASLTGQWAPLSGYLRPQAYGTALFQLFRSRAAPLRGRLVHGLCRVEPQALPRA